MMCFARGGYAEKIENPSAPSLCPLRLCGELASTFRELHGPASFLFSL